MKGDLRMKKYYTKVRIKTSLQTPDLIFYAPSLEVAIFYTEMCGFDILEAKVISIED